MSEPLIGYKVVGILPNGSYTSLVMCGKSAVSYKLGLESQPAYPGTPLFLFGSLASAKTYIVQLFGQSAIYVLKCEYTRFDNKPGLPGASGLTYLKLETLLSALGAKPTGTVLADRCTPLELVDWRDDAERTA